MPGVCVEGGHGKSSNKNVLVCIFKKKMIACGRTSIPHSRANKHRKKINKHTFKTKEIMILFSLTFGNDANDFDLILAVILCYSVQ